MTIAAPASSAELWARVRILLSLGQANEAATVAVAAWETTTWARSLSSGGVLIFDTPDMPAGWCFMHPQMNSVVVSTSTVEEFGMDYALMSFVRTQVPEPCFRRFEANNWRLLTQMQESERDQRKQRD